MMNVAGPIRSPDEARELEAVAYLFELRSRLMPGMKARSAASATRRLSRPSR